MEHSNDAARSRRGGPPAAGDVGSEIGSKTGAVRVRRGRRRPPRMIRNRNCARVRIGGRDFHFGVWGSADAKRRYAELAKGTDEESVDLARLLGEQVAKFALLGVPRQTHPTSAREIRASILEVGAPWVGFGALLDHCWSIGVPVLHVSALPDKQRKMSGMAVNIDGRSAIVLASKKSNPSWLLFDLAHELGHIALDHGTVIDGAIDEDSTDPLEKAANDFAIELITGQAGARVVREGRWLDAESLAARAQQLGKQDSIDPGHLVLSYVHRKSSGETGNFWGLATAALAKLPSEGDAAGLVRDRLAANLDWSSLPTEAAEFVARMTACQP